VDDVQNDSLLARTLPMWSMISRRFFVVGLASGAAMAPPRGAFAADDALAAAIASPIRRPENVARDKYRHPAAALTFFGLGPALSVIEIQPGAGYWTEILAPYLKPHGTYTVAIPPIPPGESRLALATSLYLRKLLKDPADYGAVIVTGLTDGIPIAPANSADLILSFRNLHDWMADGTVAAKLALIHAALKTGGVFGIEDHRGLATAPQDPRAKSGYVREDYAKALIAQAGFRLVGESPIGDNPRDTKNYPKGVWTLPPTLAMGEVDRAKYLAIGESDRWTLKFVKPR
jgi:predicted methyltransferase